MNKNFKRVCLIVSYGLWNMMISFGSRGDITWILNGIEYPESVGLDSLMVG